MVLAPVQPWQPYPCHEWSRGEPPPGELLAFGHAHAMDDRWRRLGRAIEEERSLRWRTRREFAAVADVGERTIARLELGTGTRYLPGTFAAVERALGWAPGSCEAVLSGGEPVRAKHDPALQTVIRAWPSMSPAARAIVVQVVEASTRDGW